MYAWRLWRDGRARSLIFLAGGLAWVFLVVLFGPTGAGHFDDAFRLLRHDARIQQAAWDGFGRAIADCVLLAGLLTTLFWCDLGLFADFAKQATDLLFTRPRRRRWFVWTDWAVAMAQTFAIMELIAVFAVLLLYALTGVMGSVRVLALPILLMPTFGLVHGIGYLLGMLTRGRVGAVGAFTVVGLYPIAIATLTLYFRIVLPRWWVTSLPSWAIRPGDAFPLIAVLGWVAVVLALTRVSQWTVDRADL